MDKNDYWHGKIENQKPSLYSALRHRAGRAKISEFAPILHKFSLGKTEVEFGARPVLVVAEKSIPPSKSNAECLSREGKERINVGLFCPWAGQEWLELLL